MASRLGAHPLRLVATEAQADARKKIKAARAAATRAEAIVAADYLAAARAVAALLRKLAEQQATVPSAHAAAADA